MSKVYSFKRVQSFPLGISRLWDYFSDPGNLEEITPPGMSFKTTSAFHGDKMYPGQLIEYKVKPVLKIPVYWMTEITHVKENEFFVDEQRFGPYSLWHHQHHFKEVAGGTEMTDIVHYKIPFWFFGDLANSLFVKKKLQEIFDYREKITAEFFIS